MLAGDVESNPGPYTDYDCKGTYAHTTIQLLVDKRCNYHEIILCGMYGTSSYKSTVMTKIFTVNHNFTMQLLTMATYDKVWKDVGSNPGSYTDYIVKTLVT